MSFNEKYNKIKQLAQKELDLIEEKMVSDINIREPLQTSVVEFLKAPSKHIRPLVSILYLKACNEELTEKHLDVLTLVELVHNAALIHDDISDESTIRRGRKTISAEFNNKLGVISGDYITVRLQPHRHGGPVRHQPHRPGHCSHHGHLRNAGHRRQRRGDEKNGGAQGAGGPAGFYSADPHQRRGGRGDDAAGLYPDGYPAGDYGPLSGGVRLLPHLFEQLSAVHHSYLAHV